MITNEKLGVFVRYKGDLDMWLRTGTEREQKFVESKDWHMIDLLLQDANVITRKLGSAERNAQAWERLRKNCESEEVIKEVMRIAESGI